MMIHTLKMRIRKGQNEHVESHMRGSEEAMNKFGVYFKIGTELMIVKGVYYFFWSIPKKMRIREGEHNEKVELHTRGGMELMNAEMMTVVIIKDIYDFVWDMRKEMRIDLR